MPHARSRTAMGQVWLIVVALATFAGAARPLAAPALDIRQLLGTGFQEWQRVLGPPLQAGAHLTANKVEDGEFRTYRPAGFTRVMLVQGEQSRNAVTSAFFWFPSERTKSWKVALGQLGLQTQSLRLAERNSTGAYPLEGLPAGWRGEWTPNANPREHLLHLSIAQISFQSIPIQADPLPTTPNGAALDVLYIRRTPEYPRYRVQYPRPAHHPRLANLSGRLSDADTEKHWPAEKDTVTYTAVVGNLSTLEVSRFPYRWSLDGKVVSEGVSEQAIPPGGKITVRLQLPWQFAREEIAVEVGTPADGPIISRRRSVWSHAKWLRISVLRDTFESISRVKNRFGTYSCVDWIQAHVDLMNQKFALSVYPGAPQGILDRVAIGEIVVESRPGFDREFQGDHFDGNWKVDFGIGDSAAPRAAEVDWGLVHEWGHQLGLTDLYALDVSTENIQVTDEDGLPEGLGHTSVFARSMMHGHGDVPFSEVCAAALNHQLWRRRGYYGDHYFDLAPRNFVRVLDTAGRPVVGAELVFHQRDETSGAIPAQPTFTGTTGPDGRFELPNRPAPDAVTFGDRDSGYRLRPNPFGDINVVGGNGTMLVEVRARQQRDVTFLEVAQLVVAKARAGGSAPEVTVDLLARPPAENAPFPPARPTVEISDDQVVVRAPGLAAFAVVRRRQDKFSEQWEDAGIGHNGYFSEPCSHIQARYVYRYAVCTLNGQVRSARSPVARVVTLQNPWGVTVSDKGDIYVRDRGGLWLTRYSATGEPIATVGSQHWHFDDTPDLWADTLGRIWIPQWPNGYDPMSSGVRSLKVNGPYNADDAPFLIKGRWDDVHPGHFREPMGISVSGDSVIVTDTANDRVQILGPRGEVRSVVTGLRRPHKALILDGRLIVADTGLRRIVAFAQQGGNWMQVAERGGFTDPIYLCPGPKGVLWVSDRGTGQVVALSSRDLVPTGWSYPGVSKPTLRDLRGVAYHPQKKALVYVSGADRNLVVVPIVLQ